MASHNLRLAIKCSLKHLVTGYLSFFQCPCRHLFLLTIFDYTLSASNYSKTLYCRSMGLRIGCTEKFMQNSHCGA